MRPPFPDNGRARDALALAVAAQAAFVLANLVAPGWALFDLDEEHNVPAYFHAALLGAAALLSLGTLRAEGRLLAGEGRARRRATVLWLGMAGLFAFLALDESLVLHEELNRESVRAWLAANSPLRATVTWLILLSPGIVTGVGCILAWLASRAAVSPHLGRWASAGLGLWLLSLVLEGTAKAFFMPRNLYTLEVLMEETAESLGTTAFLWAIWGYRLELRSRLAALRPLPPLRVPWPRVAVGTLLVLAVPAAVVGGTIALNPQARLKSAGDAHLRAGRLEDAVAAYRAAVARAPRYAVAWDRLGVAELRRGNLEAAAGALARAEALDPRDAEAPGHLGVVFSRQARHAEAADAFRRAAALDPTDEYAYRNLAVALRHLGRQVEAEAALRRARELGWSPIEVVAVRVDLPADLPLVYLAEPRLAEGLAHTRAGRVGAAVVAYRGAVAASPGSAAGHLALANELLRWSVGGSLARRRTTPRVREAALAPIRPGVLFTHWIGGSDRRWERGESRVESAALEAAPADAAREAGTHYRRALDLGAGAPAHLGLALLGREEGRADEAAVHAAAARALDPEVAALLAPPSGS